jgi:hypothetical protein
MATVMVEIPVDEETAAALTDPHQLQAVGELVKLMVRPAPGHDPLAVLLDATRREAAAAGLTDADIDAELAAWKAERAASRN